MDTTEERPLEEGSDDADTSSEAVGAGGIDGTLDTLAPIVGEALERVLSVIRTRGRARAQQGARVARERIDAYQARRDLDKLYQKLGREVERLVEAEEIDHPGLVKGVERVQRQHARLAGRGEE